MRVDEFFEGVLRFSLAIEDLLQEFVEMLEKR